MNLARRWGAVIVLLAALIPSAILALHSRVATLTGIYHDDAIYQVSAQSLAEGNGYRIASLPEAPFQTKYPPLFPALLAVTRGLPVELVLWLMLPLAVWLCRCLLLDAGISNVEATGIAAWLALSPVAVMFSLLSMSEMMFTVLILATLWMASRSNVPPGAVGVVAGLAFLTRSAALPMIVSAPLVYWLAGRRKQAAVFVLGMLPFVIGWQAWVATHRSPASDLALLFYTDYFGYYRQDVTLATLPTLVWVNAGATVKAIGELLVFDEEVTFFTLTLARLLTVATVVGIVRLVREGKLWQYAAFGALYTAQFLIWNYPPNSRFLLPLLPLFAAGAWSEARHLGRVVAVAFRKPKMGDKVVAVFFMVLLAAGAVYALRQVVQGLRVDIPSIVANQQREQERVAPVYRWLAENTPREARVLSYADPVVYLRTGRRGISLRVPPHILAQGDEAVTRRFFGQLPEVVRGHGIGYVLSAADDYHLDAPAVTLPAWRKSLEGAGWAKVFEGDGVVVYRVK